MGEKIEIIVQPIKKIVVFECTEFSIEEFFKRIEFLQILAAPYMGLLLSQHH